MRVDLRGRRWSLVVVERLPEASHGDIDPHDRPQKQIRIALNQAPLDKLDTVLHECLHACLPDLCEDTITETATDIAKVLHRMGCKINLEKNGKTKKE